MPTARHSRGCTSEPGPNGASAACKPEEHLEGLPRPRWRAQRPAPGKCAMRPFAVDISEVIHPDN